MSSAAARKASASLFSFASLDAARTRATPKELAAKVFDELRDALPTRTDAQNTPLAAFTRQLEDMDRSQPALADLELFLRSKRVFNKLMEQYNPLYGMSEQERIKATARTVGLDVPSAPTA
ncbi:hypothetical protein CBS9595_001243 [Malassezia furfur]|nr:hypothetical protein CBS9595_001243 [Malassezia furfur]